MAATLFREVDITAAPDDVWRALCDVAAWPEWAEAVSLDLAEVAKDRRGEVAIALGEGRQLRSPVRISALVPARRLQLVSTGWRGVLMRQKHDLVLTETEERTTRFRASVGFGGPVGRLLTGTEVGAGTDAALGLFTASLARHLSRGR
jgi:uncharacterized protein YndB with AHSA1/START domain